MHHGYAYDTYAAGHPDTVPPPPSRDVPYSSALRRANISPPLLTTALAAQAGSIYSTPLSAISHQSPFTPVYASPMVASMPGGIRGVSPLPPRQTNQYGASYDPRDWTSGDVRANQARRVREQHGEDGLASPPPPYSPNTATQPQSSTVNSPNAADLSPSVPTQSPQDAIPRPRTLYQHGITASNRHSVHLSYPVPPPPPSGTNVHPGAVLSNGSGLANAPANPTFYPPTSRRAVSATAGPSRQPELGLNSRSNSRQRIWQPGMPLPGPPPGAPPAAPRSQSVSTGERAMGISASRSRTIRPLAHSSELGPIPSTPLNWADEPSSASTPVAAHDSSRVDTNAGQISRSQTQPELEGSSSSTPSYTPNTGNAALSRSSAVRDSSIQGLRERREQKRLSRSITAAELNDLSVQTNPWASAMGQGQGSKMNSPTESNSAPNSGRQRRKPFTPIAGVFGDSQITESPLDAATPPISTPIRQTTTNQSRLSVSIPKALRTPPLSQPTPLSADGAIASSRGSVSGLPSDEPDSFVLKAKNRHADFLHKEKAASSDAARLQLFADYILAEVSIRQQRYRSVIQSGSFDVQAIRDKLFEPNSTTNSVSTTVERTSTENRRPSIDTRPQIRHETSWKEYEPALSPIASMDYDEMSSRGRAPGRWWESQSGSQSGSGQGRHVLRSKRESKYMGLSKELLMVASPDSDTAMATHGYHLSPNAGYPSEKASPENFGYYDDSSRRTSQIYSRGPETPALLDISRFITLPPPYPRHYPAVNNNHPDLAQFRTTVRTLSDLSAVHDRKQRHKISNEALQEKHKRKLSDSRRAFRTAVQTQIDEGSISYAEAAEAEQAHKASELGLEKSRLQAEFDTLQDVVINPLHNLLNERMSQLNSSLQKLQDDLRVDARRQDPDGPQEEGDETPELLEKLTQLKWLFDTREQIHKECFDILSNRNNKFRAIVLLPYQAQGNIDKVRDTEKFFDEDTRTRRTQYCADSVKRHEDFLKTIDEHVRRGVELQSSAFWDIAPGLLDVLQKIPEDLRNLPGLQIPADEYKENPAYHQHPQQYLYSLLSHAEKSTYQYIEGQTNLQCLLHEVKTSLSAARYRYYISRENADGEAELAAAKLKEEAALTAELKQKASMIEEQWLEALGSQLQGTRERVKTLLQQNDAWEDIAQDD